MSHTFSRRHFLGASLTAATTTLVAGTASGQTAFLKLLTGPGAEGRIFTILVKYLPLASSHRGVVKVFTASLQQNLVHTEPPEEFRRLLGEKADTEALATYVVQEFLVSTNYLAVAAGHTDRLTNLTA